ncbi:GRP family sugar transporter [Weissella halotolerans]|uniref:Glucose uptake permease n=1 Tax=Weissella halotolerans DSM 20190 TaxID=1123500 RepID=A0A0R2FTK8_9LACO|nr:GRP family sugar transporter [Weissella halotolerans]KRN30822.1 glucose uptake permease [Weissella halotolerans DSM 20190]
MSILIALIPALAWGSVGIVTTKMGGTAAQGTLGMTFGALVFGLVSLFGYVLPNFGAEFAFNPRIWLVGFVSGLFWAVGTAGQFVAFKKLGVSVGNPLSTAGQIVANALMAAAVLGEWTTAKMWFFGLISIVLVAGGAVLTALPDPKQKKESQAEKTAYASGFTALIISTIGYMMYFVFPNLLSKLGFISEAVRSEPNGSGLAYMTSIVGPQSLGQVIGAFVVVIFFMKEGHQMFEAGTWRNMTTGLVWALGNIFMFISAANPQVGQATATTLSQLGVLVGTFGGIYILGEKKTKRQMVYIVIGAFLVVLGAIMISNLGKL